MTEHGGCPGSRMVDMKQPRGEDDSSGARVSSQLGQWPIQLHLIAPTAPYYQEADVILTADCVAYAMGNFHTDYLKGNSIAIACPKLDEGQDIYIDKVKSWFEEAKINSLTILIMQVPCCHGLVGMAIEALKRSERKVPVKYVVVSLQGEVLQEEWVDIQ